MPLTILPGLPGNPFEAPTLGSNWEATIHVVSEGNPLGSTERGLVLESPWEAYRMASPTLRPTNRPTVGVHLMQRLHLNPSELVQGVLFWDRLHMPESIGGVGEPKSDALAVLRREGLIRTFSISYDDEAMLRYVNPVEVWTYARLSLFEQLEQSERGQWGLSQGLKAHGEVGLTNNFFVPDAGTLVRLHKALPIPDGSVRIEDVIDHRYRYADQLLRLRKALLRTFDTIQATDDPGRPLREREEIRDLEREVDEYIARLKERKFPSIASSLSAIQNVLPDLGKIAWNASLAYAQNGSLGMAALGGVPDAISVVRTLGLKKATTVNPYEYVGLYHTELPWDFNKSAS